MDRLPPSHGTRKHGYPRISAVRSKLPTLHSAWEQAGTCHVLFDDLLRQASGHSQSRRETETNMMLDVG